MVWYKVQNNAPPARPKPRPGGYYAHPGADTSQPADDTVPIRTQPETQQAGHKQSVWQRMFGSSSSY
jgi:hypothetical protein